MRYRDHTIEVWLARFDAIDLREGAAEHECAELLEVMWREAGLSALPIVLEAASSSSSPRRQLGALLVLSGLPARASVPCLIACLHSPRQRVRLHALRAICELGEAGFDARAALLDCLTARDERERALAARALRFVGRRSPELAAPLLAAARDRVHWVREEAALALGELADPRGEGLPDGLAQTAAQTLAEWALLADEGGCPTALAAARIDPAPVVAMLCDAWRRESSRASRRRWLRRLEWLGPRVPEVVAGLPVELDDHERMLVFARAGAAAAELIPRLEARLADSPLRGFEDCSLAGCLEDLRHDLGRLAVERALAGEPFDASRLHPDRARLAALCGLPLARAGEQPRPARELAVWVEQLAELGPVVCARVVLALARTLLAIWEYAHPLDLPPRFVVQEFQVWLAKPSAVSRAILERSAAFDFRMGTGLEARAAGQAIQALARFPSDAPRDGMNCMTRMIDAFEQAIDASRVSLTARLRPPSEVLEPLPGYEAALRLRAAVERELIGWALGVWDPVAVWASVPARRAWLAPPRDDPSLALPRRFDGQPFGRDGWGQLVELLDRLEWSWTPLDEGRSLRVEFEARAVELAWDAERRWVVVQHQATTTRIEVGAAFEPAALLALLESERSRP